LFDPRTIGRAFDPSISAEWLSFGVNPRKGIAMSDQGDIEDVRAEVGRLREEVERLEAKPEKRQRLRRIFAVVFVVLAVVAASAATPGVWARRTVYDTDRFVAVVGPLASDPAIQQALAVNLTSSVFTALDVQSKVQSALADAAPKLEFIAGPITNGVQGFVQDQVQKILASAQFQQFWNDTITRLQPQVIAVLNGTSQVIQQQGNQVVFNYLPLLNEALSQMSQTLSGILGRQITLPTITADTVPSQAIAALDTALGVQLPETFGSVVLFEGDQLTTIQNAASIFDKTLVLALALFVVSVVLALVLSTNRRRTLLQLVAALIIVVVLERRFAIAEADHVISMMKPENQAAGSAIVHAFLSSLLLTTRRTLWVLFAILVVALLSGPYPWAVRLRAWTVDGSRAAVGAVRGADLGPASIWVGAHRDPLMIGGVVLAAVILLFTSLSLGWFLVLLLVLGAFELVVYRLAAATERPRAV
jgi:hypothetical protein